MIVTLEGIDGCGKTTLARNLERVLSSRGEDVEVVSPFQSTYLGVALRDIAKKKYAKSWVGEVSVFLAALGELADYMVTRPKGTIVIADRYDLSCAAYQSIGASPQQRTDLSAAIRFATDAVKIDHTIYLHAPAEITDSRMATDDFASWNAEYRKLVSERYRELIKMAVEADLLLSPKEKRRYHIISAALEEEDVTKRALRELGF